ncbi:MAG: dTMP kinase [Alphaproteobacteria bacterium]|nr:dTMP kinase [Rickettsiales bacterium]
MFITIEGIDGAGKTTQAKLLSEYIAKNIILTNELDSKPNAKNIILTNEPNDGRFDANYNHNSNTIEKMTLGQVVRSLISAKDEIDETTRLLLIYAARRKHVENVINPALKDGKIIICDRFYDSSIAYFGYKEEIGFEKAKEFTDFLHNNTIQNRKMPDLTFYIDVEPRVASKRIKQRDSFGDLGKMDNLDRMGETDVNKIGKIFTQLVESDKKRCVKIQGNGKRSVEEIHEEIKKIARERIEEAGKFTFLI